MTDLEIDLPILVLREIFKSLSLSERMRCKRVSKTWKFAVETTEPQRDLCVYSYSYPCGRKWPASKQKIASKDLLYCNSNYPEFLTFKTNLTPFLQNLERLFLFHAQQPDALLESLPQMSRLKVLVVHAWEPSELRKLKVIRSTSLEKLSLVFEDEQEVCLELDTPNLSSLILWTFGPSNDPNDHDKPPITLRFPLRLKNLECLRFHPCFKACENLETLVCKMTDLNSNEYPFSLEDFRSLQMVNLFDWPDFVRFLKEEREKLDRENLKVLEWGLDSIFFPCILRNRRNCEFYEDALRKLAENRSKLHGDIPWNSQFDFAALYESFRCVPQDLPAMFRNISRITIDGSISKLDNIEPLDVIKFLVPTNVVELIVEHRFKKEFYERLLLVKSIKELVISELPSDLNLAYLLKLKNLIRLEIYPEELPKEFGTNFVRKCFKTLKFFQSVSFFSGRKPTPGFFDVQRRDDKRFSLSYLDTSTEYEYFSLEDSILFENLDELLKEETIALHLIGM